MPSKPGPQHFFPPLGPAVTSRGPAKTRRRTADVVAETVASHPQLLTSQQAMDQLGVKRQTLYAYVSRGMIRTAHAPGSTENLYFRDDVEAVGLKGRQKGTHQNPAERALKWGGSPVLQSSITRLTQSGPYYRGISALELARSHCSFERCAQLLWSARLPPAEPVWPVPRPSRHFTELSRGIESVARHNSARPLMVLAIEGYGAALGDAWVEMLEAPEAAAKQLIAVLASSFGLLRAAPAFELPESPRPISELVLRSAGIVVSASAIRAIDASLVLCADHELATATFVSRISASAGASILSCVTSALSSSEGMLVGVDCDGCENMLRHAGGQFRYVETLAQLLSEGQAVPGYNHPAYPGGDPRGRFLLEVAREAGAGAKRESPFVDCIDQASFALGIAPSVAAGLIAVCDALQMPNGSAGALMALSRTAGWIAHAFEQRESGYLIRPRSRFVGIK